MWIKEPTPVMMSSKRSYPNKIEVLHHPTLAGLDLKEDQQAQHKRAQHGGRAHEPRYRFVEVIASESVDQCAQQGEQRYPVRQLKEILHKQPV
jgi:hypothetical protein